jgi:GNAT superfamily N-acetyltransferase
MVSRDVIEASSRVAFSHTHLDCRDQPAGIRDGMLVRPARSEDLPDISRLAADLVRMHHRLDPDRFMLIEPVEDGYQWFFSGELKRERARILVAEEAGRTCGYAYATVEARNWNDLLDACGKLNDLYVAADSRPRDPAPALVEATFAWFRARRAPRVVLLSAWQNPEAHAFFEALGFRRTMLEMTAELAT